MGTSLVRICPYRNHLNNPDMRTSVVLGLGLLLLAMASLTEADCDNNGCCWVNGRTGDEINQGSYSTTCNDGFRCTAAISKTGRFYGVCDDGLDNSLDVAQLTAA